MNKLGFLHDNLAKNRLVSITDNFFNVYFMLLVWFFYNNKKKNMGNVVYWFNLFF